LDIKIKLRNSASCWFLLYEYITMHGPQNVKRSTLFFTAQYSLTHFYGGSHFGVNLKFSIVMSQWWLTL